MISCKLSPRVITARILQVIGYHFLFGMPAGTAAFMLWDILVIEGSELARYELYQIPFLAVPFSIVGALVFWPLPICGGLFAAALRTGFGLYRWWMAALAGVLLWIAVIPLFGFDREPDGSSYSHALLAACVAAMLGSMRMTNRIMSLKRV